MKKLLYILAFTAIVVSCKKDDEQQPEEPVINKEFYFSYLQDGETVAFYGKDAYYGKMGEKNVLFFSPQQYSIGFAIFDIAKFSDIKKGEYIIDNSNLNRCGAKVVHTRKYFGDFSNLNLDKNYNGKKIFIDSVYTHISGIKVINGRIENPDNLSRTDFKFNLLVYDYVNIAEELNKDRVRGFIEANVDGKYYKENIYNTQTNNTFSKTMFLASTTLDELITSPVYINDYEEPGFVMAMQEVTGNNKSTGLIFNNAENCTVKKYLAVKDSFYIDIQNITWLSIDHVRFKGAFNGIIKNNDKRMEVKDGRFEINYIR